MQLNMYTLIRILTAIDLHVIVNFLILQIRDRVENIN